MCLKKCSDSEKCRYDRENCEYKCVWSVLPGLIVMDQYTYSSAPQIAAASGLAAIITAINF